VVAAVGVAQIAALLLLAAILGWRLPVAASWPALVYVAGAAISAFAGLGLLLAGTLRQEGTLVLANILFLIAILFGGIVAPIDALPGVLGGLASILPWGGATNGIRAALEGGDVVSPLAVLLVWAIGAVALAFRTFRWE
jgi:ABC-2 type transport system permease protein